MTALTMKTSSYRDFIVSKSQHGKGDGFEPNWIPDCAFDFQKHCIDWSVRKGRAALYQDCGMGKSLQELAWCENVVRHTNKPVLLATPIAVGPQFIKEATKFGVDAELIRDGKKPTSPKVYISNYEQLHKFDPADFAAFAGDEFSCVKDSKSERKQVVKEFTRNMRYRMGATATPSPNDFFELGNASEILGYLGFRDMLTMFFREEIKTNMLGWNRTKYRFRGHAEQPFWSWVCSWARALRKPSDLGFSDDKFVLPELIEREIVVDTVKARPGQLFPVPAKSLPEQRAERRHSLNERCEKAAELANAHNGSVSIWCELNDEGTLLRKMLKDSVEVSGSMKDEQKEENFEAFSSGQIKNIILKPKIGAYGLNWQHCHRAIVFPSNSFEQYYQLVRRHYRFGQKEKVEVDLIVSEGEVGITKNLQRKQSQATRMFESLVKHMHDALSLTSDDSFPCEEERPSWL